MLQGLKLKLRIVFGIFMFLLTFKTLTFSYVKIELLAKGDITLTLESIHSFYVTENAFSFLIMIFLIV